MAHIRQSRPDSGIGFHVKVLKTFQVVPFSLGSGEDSPRMWTPDARNAAPNGGRVFGRAARPSERARCGTGAGCSAMNYQSMYP